LHSLALNAQGQGGRAQAELAQALRLARPEGFLRVFIDLGPPMQAMLISLPREGASAATIGNILAAFPKPGPQSQPVGVSTPPDLLRIETLAKREREILSLLREPIGIKEIAFRLGISYPNVKRHTINIYNKLNVHTRQDAIAIIAQQNNFLY
jgi:LuxR family maltose regulon positive regulatory protein